MVASDNQKLRQTSWKPNLTILLKDKNIILNKIFAVRLVAD